MTRNELEEYLEIIVDMEKSVYMQKIIIEKMEQEIENLGIRRKIIKPEPSVDAEIGILIKLGLVFASFATIVLGIGSGILGIVLLKPDNAILIWKIIYIVVGVLFLGGAVKLLEISFEAISYLYRCKKAKLEYEEAKAKYKEYIRADKKRVKEELIHREYIITELQKFEELHKSTVWTLEKFYEKNIISPNYRNFVAVSSLYEYIRDRRYYSLEGPDGAYNRFEEEIRLDRIIAELDTVVRCLSSIRNSQTMLYSAIQESNRRSDMIIDSINNMSNGLKNLNENMNEHNRIQDEQIKKIQQNTYFAAYCAEQSQKELQYMNRMNYLLGKNDDVFYNFPSS